MRARNARWGLSPGSRPPVSPLKQDQEIRLKARFEQAYLMTGVQAPPALDPDYPAERLAFMVEDAQAPVVLTQAAVAVRLPKLRGQVVQVEREEEDLCVTW